MDFLIESQIKVYPTVGDFPATGAVKTLYIDESTSTTYYWTGSAYSEIRTEAKYEAIDVLNGTGSSQPKMTVCYLKTSSSSANTPEILLSNANSEATSSKTIGLLLATIANGATGKLITSGEFDKFDTSAYNVGDRLWLSTTDGQMTTTVPSAPNHAVFIGIVTRKQSQNGRILVAIQNGYELQELHNVSITSPVTNQGIFYNSVTGLWENKTIVSALGYTPVPTTRTLTINGTTQDLSADRTFTISTGITIGTTAITSGTVGRVLFEGTGNVVQESANLFWDNTNVRLGVGISTPLSPLHVVGSATSGFDAIRFKGQYSETGYLATSNGAIYLASGAGVTGSFLELSSAVANLRGGTTAVTFTVGSERMRINNSGNVLINTTTDAGFKLDVNGTARFQSDVTVANSLMKIYVTGGAIRFEQQAGAGIPINFMQNGNIYQYIDQATLNIAFRNDYSFVMTTGNTSTINASAKMQIDSTTKGFLCPRMTTTQKNAIASPATGLMVYDTTLNLISVYNGTIWITL